MKRTLLATCVAFLFMTAYAQENSYIVKTRGALQKSELQLADQEGEDETAVDFISQNFKYQSLCDWKEGMKFMVIPDKYDLVVKTFTDASTDKDVSNVKLRHKIMIYQGHEENGEGHERINFLCQDDNRKYYYDITGTFDDYCYEKQGIPTLAYLGDVDIAREKLVNKEVYTKTDVYRIDTEIDGDGYKNVLVDKDVMVKITAVGVGTRDFPVKIIVEDGDGNEFYQNVAISKTNCSLNINSSNYRFFLGKIIHTKYPTKLLNEFSKKLQSIPRLTEYQIEAINPHKNSDKFTVKLKNTTIGTYFYTDVILDEYLAQDQTEYFGYLFAMGPGKKIQTSEGSRAMIRAGHVSVGFSEDETMMAAGEPDKVVVGDNGQYTWVYQRSNNKLLYVDFNGSGVVSKTYTRDNTPQSKSTKRRSTVKKKTNQRDSWLQGKGTPL